jgi:hypothetical protein
MKNRRIFLSSLFLLLLLLPVEAASADIGPKPTMEFTFEYETGVELTIVEGELLQCEDPTCSVTHPLEQLGPQGFSCTETSCSSMAYSYTGDNILVITFSDGVTRQSNQFGKQHFDAEYTVTVYQDELVVVETGGGGTPISPIGALIGLYIAMLCTAGGLLILLLVSLGVLIARGGREESVVQSSKRWIILIWVIGVLYFLGSLLITAASILPLSMPLTLLIEGAVLAVYCAIRKQPMLAPLTLNLGGNLITQVALWFVIVSQISGTDFWLVILIGEALIVLIEAAILFWPQRRTLTFKQALALSFVLNLISFTVGLFLGY